MTAKIPSKGEIPPKKATKVCADANSEPSAEQLKKEKPRYGLRGGISEEQVGDYFDRQLFGKLEQKANQVTETEKQQAIDRLKLSLLEGKDVEREKGWAFYPAEMLGRRKRSSTSFQRMAGDLIGVGEIVIIAGQEGVGKTALSLPIGRCARGIEPLFGLPELANEAGELSCSIIEYEMGRDRMEIRHGSLFENSGIHLHTYEPGGELSEEQINDDAFLEEYIFGRDHEIPQIRVVANHIIKRGIQVVQVDNWTTLCESENRADIVRVLKQLNKMRHTATVKWKRPATIIIYAHTRKNKALIDTLTSDELIGSSAQKQLVDSVIMMAKCEDPNQVYLKHTKLGRLGKGVFTGGAHDQVLVLNRKTVDLGGGYEEYHLEAVPGVHFENDVRQKPNQPTVQKNPDAIKAIATASSTLLTKQRNKWPEWEITPVKIKNHIQAERKAMRENNVEAHVIDYAFPAMGESRLERHFPEIIEQLNFFLKAEGKSELKISEDGKSAK